MVALRLYSTWSIPVKFLCLCLITRDAGHPQTLSVTSDMQGLVWGEPELAHEYDFDVEKIIAKFEVCNMEECNFLVFCSFSL